jgi:signal transduction histidine kinase
MPETVALRLDFRRIAALLIAFALCIPVAWELRNPTLIRLMAPNTALCFILCGVSLLLFQKHSRWARVAAFASATAVLFFAAAFLAEHLKDLNFGIDGLFLHNRMDLWYAPNLPAGRIAQNTSIAFVLAAIGLLLLHARVPVQLSQLFGVAVLGVAYMGLVGHLYGVPAFYSGWMSKTTASTFMALSFGMLAANPSKGIAGIVLRQSAGGFLARRLLLVILPLIPFLGFIRVMVDRQHLASPSIITAVLVSVNVAIQVSTFLLVAAALNTAEERRENAEVALRRGEKLAATGRFAATVAHEMNNPLAAVVNLIYLAQSSKETSPHVRSLLEAAQQELKRVSHISRQTLAFYKDNATAEDFEVAELLQDILFIMQAKIRNKSLVLETRCADCWIHAIKGEVRQVISNLISNAIDASRDGGIIVLRGGPCGENKVRIEVTDNGNGISSGDLKKLYQPFFTTKADVGNGLGLWVSKNLVEKNSGTITVTTSTDPGKSGTSFSVTFPVGAPNVTRIAQKVG